MYSIYSEKNNVIIDITKAPYYADNTGKEDCTEVLKRALDDILRPNIEGIEKTRKVLMENDDPNAKISFEIRKENNVPFVIFPEELNKTQILYFPNGTYLVSDTITYTLENLQNIYNGLPCYEINRQIHFKGESRDGVVIKLADSCRGFEYGTQKPIVSFMQGESSNIAMTNTFEDITIDAGANNPGAVGLVFFANNSGTVKNVKIVSTDKNKRGYTGLFIKHEIVSGCYVKDVVIDGFDYGIRAIPVRNFSVFENITVKNQRKTGFYIKNMIISIRRLISENTVTGLCVDGPSAHVTLVDSCIRGGNPYSSAVECKCGSCFVRNVETKGYKSAITYAQEDVCESSFIKEYVSDRIYTAFETQKVSEPVIVKDIPVIPYSEDMAEWAYVNDFGAVGDGVHDDTAAIQRAMDCGKKYIRFGQGQYLVKEPIEVPNKIERINFMFCDFAVGEQLSNCKDKGIFVVKGDEGTLVLEDVFTWEKCYGFIRFIEHAGKRTLILSDLHTQTAAMYFNTAEGGEVFIENCACTVGGFGDSPYRKTPAFSFTGQKVWARHINPERSFCEILNDGGQMWIMGFKTENYGTAFKTIHGGHTEVLGGTISIGAGKELPAIINEESTVSIVATTNGYTKDEFFPITVEETQHNIRRLLKYDIFPNRLLNCYKIPLYVGRNKAWKE